MVVTCEATGRQESFSIDDIIEYDIMSYDYYGVYNETAFDGEGLLTAAVDGVLTAAARTVCQTSGHGEAALSADVTEQPQRSHMAPDSVNLLPGGGIRALLFIPVIPGILPVSGFVRRMRRRKF